MSHIPKCRIYTLSKAERLKSRKNIETLFQSGEAFSFYPFRIIYRFENLPDNSETESAAIQMGISVPKKKLNRAHDRNRIKRLTREAWRTNNLEVKQAIPSGVQLHLFFVYTPFKQLLSFEEVNTSMKGIVIKLIQKISNLSIDKK